MQTKSFSELERINVYADKLSDIGRRMHKINIVVEGLNKNVEEDLLASNIWRINRCISCLLNLFGYEENMYFIEMSDKEDERYKGKNKEYRLYFVKEEIQLIMEDLEKISRSLISEFNLSSNMRCIEHINSISYNYRIIKLKLDESSI